MKLRLLAIGARPEDWVRAGVAQYLGRLPPHLKPEFIDVPLKEGERLLQRLKPDEFVIALDERGQSLSSAELARKLTTWQNRHPALALVIGGPEGLDEGVRTRANFVWSLSRLTFPHGLVRVLVMEQLYRAWTILKGHPYHKA